MMQMSKKLKLEALIKSQLRICANFNMDGYAKHGSITNVESLNIDCYMPDNVDDSTLEDCTSLLFSGQAAIAFTDQESGNILTRNFYYNGCLENIRYQERNFSGEIVQPISITLR